MRTEPWRGYFGVVTGPLRADSSVSELAAGRLLVAGMVVQLDEPEIVEG